MPAYSVLYQAAPWSLAIFGEHGIFQISITEDSAKRAHQLFPEAELTTTDLSPTKPREDFISSIEIVAPRVFGQNF